MNICFTADEKFIPQLEVTIASIFCNADKDDLLKLYLITNGLKDSTKNFLKKKYPNLSILEIKMDENIKNYPLVSNSSNIVYLRLKIPSILHELDKVLYLDCDIIVTSSLKELYNYDISDNLAGVVADIGVPTLIPNHIKKLKIENYFNAGVMLMNLKQFRKENVEEKLHSFLQNNKGIIFQDQDALNVVCNNKVIFLPQTYNYQVNSKYSIPSNISPTVIHYVGNEKPWLGGHFLSTTPQYWNYIFKTRHVFHFLSIFIIDTLKKLKKFLKYACKQV